MIEFILSGIIAGLIPLIGIYIAMKRGSFDDFIQDNIAIFLQEAATDADIQKNLFTFGGILGNGLKIGAGFNKKGGKFGMQEFLMQLAAHYLMPDGGIAPAMQKTTKDPRLSL